MCKIIIGQIYGYISGILRILMMPRRIQEAMNQLMAPYLHEGEKISARSSFWTLKRWTGMR